MSVKVEDIPVYARATNERETIIAIGIDFWGFLVSSPEIIYEERLSVNFFNTCGSNCIKPNETIETGCCSTKCS